MKITLGNFVLAGNPPTEAPADFRIDGTELVDPKQRLRALSTKPEGRGNTQMTVSFTVTRLHASLRIAEGYMLKHETDLPKVGTVKFFTQDPNGSENEYYMHNAALQSHQGQHHGLTTIHNYQLTGGQISVSSKP